MQGDGTNIGRHGMHMGLLYDGRVYDNNVPFGVPEAAWKAGYYILSFPEYTELDLQQADKNGNGKLSNSK